MIAKLIGGPFDGKTLPVHPHVKQDMLLIPKAAIVPTPKESKDDPTEPPVNYVYTKDLHNVFACYSPEPVKA